MKKVLLGVAALAALAGVANADVLYSNAPTTSGNAYSSQNDTISFGNFATVFGFFTTGGATWNVTDVHFWGEYFNPPEQGNITGWTVKIFGDAGNAPGALLSTTWVAGNGNETAVGNWGGFPAFHYDLDVTPTLVTGDAWVAVVPDLGFPPQWGVADGVDLDPAHAAYQDFFGSVARLPQSMAVEITGNVVPAPASLALLGLGGLAAGRRRR